MTQDFTVYERLKKAEFRLDLYKDLIYHLSQELKKAQKDIEELKKRTCDDDCK